MKYCVGGEWLESKTDKWMEVTDSSTGEVIAEVPCSRKASHAPLRTPPGAHVRFCGLIHLLSNQCVALKSCLPVIFSETDRFYNPFAKQIP